MRKILLAVLLVLLIVLAVFSISKGFQVGSLEIFNVSKIGEKNDELDKKISDINKLIDTTYPSKLSELRSASDKMNSAKEDYLKLTNISSDEQILEALNSKSYNIEFIRTSLGNYANSKGVDIKLEISSSNSQSGIYNLNFTVNGTYISIINFVEAIENDTKLNFRINGFKLLPSGQGTTLQATFAVNNVAINGLTSSSSSSSGMSGISSSEMNLPGMMTERSSQSELISSSEDANP